MNNITAKDLMIGDWVMVAESVADAHFIYYPDKIESIRDGLVGLESDGLETIIERIAPIPLTAQILEKNGFAYKEADETCATEAFHQWHLDGSRFAIDDDSWWRSVKDGELHVKFGGFSLKYVHELQHALRLCKIDKEITI